MTRRLSALLPPLVGLALVAAACGSSTNTKSATTSTAASTSPAGGGGILTLGAEQEPDCADWVGSCAGSSWGAWSMQYQTMPRVFDFVDDGGVWKYQPSALMAGEPTVVTSPKQVVTYKLNPKAVWSDLKPITCTDFKYTWSQIATGKDIYDTTGYIDIESVDDTKADTCVVTFKNSFAGWRQLFTSLGGVMPSHLLDGKDRDAEMKDGYTWSGGPFKIEKWEKGSQIILVPNENYWGNKAKADKVVFKVISDTAAQFQAFKAGEIMAIYPQPQISTIEQMKAGGLDATQIVSAKTGNVESLWMNNAKAPFDSKAVRQAVAYSLDRDAIVKALFGGINVDKAANSLNPPIQEAYADINAFAMYKKDLAKVDSLMTGEGWTKGADGIWAKAGQKATIKLNSTAGNKRRELTGQVLQEQLKAAGFDLVLDYVKAGDLFGKLLPAGDYQLGLYAQVATSLDPGLCSIACSKNIPTAANNNVGQNWQRINVPGLDKELTTVDQNPDDKARAAAGKAADKLMAENQVSLPLDPLPNISLVSKKIDGKISDNPILSVFWNLSTWSLKK